MSKQMENKTTNFDKAYDVMKKVGRVATDISIVVSMTTITLWLLGYERNRK